MRGRFREICRGDNVDLGTAAAFRAQWAAEAGNPVLGTGAVPARDAGPPRLILLQNDQAVGDSLVMTAAIYSLHRAHPNRFITAVETPWPAVFDHNPDVVGLHPGMRPLAMHYPAVGDSNRRAIHFMQGWCEFLGFALGVTVPLLTNRPHLYFTDSEPPTEDYWVICTGVKPDFTAKGWGHHNYQAVVDQLKDDVNFMQVGEKLQDHEPLYLHNESRCLVSCTTLRQLFDLVRRARGVLCGVSLLMHVAAALGKPAVVIAGGREPVAWNAYPLQQYVHTVGALQCVDSQGKPGGACWRSNVVAKSDDPLVVKETCLRPVGGIPECMTMISPVSVVELIKRYNGCGGVRSPTVG